MSYTVTVSEDAEQDLKGIYQYIALELLSPDNALGQLNRLERAILSLDEMPYRFREYGNAKWRKRGLRIMPVDHYCVFYIPDDSAAVVTVIRVIYSARDLDALWSE